MQLSRRVQVFAGRHPTFGPIIWILSIQFFVAQIIAATAWDIVPYSWANNVISDLGNTECAPYAGRFVCSPEHLVMNLSFVALGAFMALGSLLIYQGFKKNPGSFIGFSFMAIAGFGTVLVGLFPENDMTILHGLGAFLVFLFGNLALVILGSVLQVPKFLRYYTVLSGVIALVALLLFASRNYLWLGEGGMERLAAYPQTFWLIVFGAYISAHRFMDS